MSNAYEQGQKNAQNTTSAPAYQTLRNSGMSDDQASRFLKGYEDKKKN